MNKLSYFHTRLFSIASIVLLLTLLLTSCGVPTEPVEFKSGEHQCSYCKMGIVDMRFRGEIISSKGKLHYFDSIECLGAWSHSHAGEISSAWVGNFLQKGKWINMKQALIMHSTELKSPMGAGLSAYETQAELEQAQKEYTGTVLNSAELEAHIKKWNKKPAEPKHSMDHKH